MRRGPRSLVARRPFPYGHHHAAPGVPARRRITPLSFEEAGAPARNSPSADLARRRPDSRTGCPTTRSSLLPAALEYAAPERFGVGGGGPTCPSTRCCRCPPSPGGLAQPSSHHRPSTAGTRREHPHAIASNHGRDPCIETAAGPPCPPRSHPGDTPVRRRQSNRPRHHRRQTPQSRSVDPVVCPCRCTAALCHADGNSRPGLAVFHVKHSRAEGEMPGDGRCPTAAIARGSPHGFLSLADRRLQRIVDSSGSTAEVGGWFCAVRPHHVHQLLSLTCP